MSIIWNFLSSKSLWVFLGVLGLALLIWFFGPLLAIGEFRPFANTYIRFIVTVCILLIWFVKFAIKQIRRAKINANLVKEIQIAQEPMLKHVSKDSEMSQQFAEIDRVLKNAKFSKSKIPLLGDLGTGQYLYQMPWYVVLGAAGSGKTTALKQSGLNFPLESSFGSSITGLAGTRDCDWFLTDNAVFLDTAGRLSLHDSNNEHDAYDWQEFISLLKRYRPKQPINGVILTVGIDDLLNPNVDFKQLSYELRKRIHEMSINLEIDFPVYLMITKFDRLKGFSDFFQGLTDEQRKQSLGFDFSDLNMNNANNSEMIIGYVSKKLLEIQENINAASIKVISELTEQQSKDAAFVFSSEFEYLSTNLLSLFRELYKTSKFEKPIAWRGIYFTSALQQGETIDPVFENLGLSLSLNKKYSSSENAQTPITKSFFLQDFFEYRILSDASLASENKKWSTKKLILYWSGFACIAVLSSFILIFMINSYFNNSRYLDGVSKRTLQSYNIAQNIGTSDDFLSRIEFADDVRKLYHTEKSVLDLSKPNLSYRFGLYQPSTMSVVTESAYQRLLQSDVMPLVSKEIDAILKKSDVNKSFDAYNALKAYLMIFDKKHYDAEFLNTWVIHFFLQKSEKYTEEQKTKIEQALKFILSQKNLAPNIAYDAGLVDLKRAKLANLDMSDMIISGVFYDVRSHESKLPITSFETMGGKQTKLVFSRSSGKPITAGIHYFYTKEAYTNYVLPALIKYSFKFHQEDWVLGEYSSTKINEVETLKNAHEMYLDLYIQAWKNYIGDVQLREPKNIKEARDITKILSDQNNSPLANIIKGVSDNTSLTIVPETNDNALIEKYMQNLTGKIGLGDTISASDLENKYINSINKSNIVDDAFSDFHALTRKQDGQPSTLVGIISSIKDLYEYLDVLNIAIEKGINLPPNDSLFKYRSEINRLPMPFKAALEKFSNFALDKSLNEKDLRAFQAHEKMLKEKQEEEEKAKKAQLEAEEKAKQQRAKQVNSANSMLNSQLSLANKECQDALKAGYPFVKNSSTDVSLAIFSKTFGDKNSYSDIKILSPNIAQLLQANTLKELIDRDEYYRNKYSNVYNNNLVNQTYFSKGGNSPTFDFSLGIKELDKSVDSIIIEYSDKNFKYSHGPLNVVDLTWPPKNEKLEAKIRLIKDNKEIANITSNGIWSIFRLIEKSDKREWQNNKLLTEYIIDEKKIKLEFSSRDGRNPFNFSILRDFKCP